MNEEFKDIMYGYHSCYDFLKNSPDNVNKLLIAKENYKKYFHIIKLAKEKGIRIDVREKYLMDKIAKGKPHQGLILFISPYRYYLPKELLNINKKAPLFILLDGIEDPQNLGSIIRTAAAAEVDGIFLENRRCAPVTSTVMKVSCGGLTKVKICRINNLKNIIPDLREMNLPIISAIPNGNYLWTAIDYSNGAALIFGGENKGVRRTLVENSDYTISIPLKNEINSLNVSVSVGIIIYEAFKQIHSIRTSSHFLIP